MQNLVLKKFDKIPLFKKDSDKLIVDSDYKVSTVASSGREILSITSEDAKSSSNHQLICCQDFSAVVKLGCRIIYSCYITEDELVFILYNDGKIITYDVVNNIMEHIIDVPEVICDAKFSHDQELLVICTANNQMLLFNKLLRLKRQYDLNTEEYGVNEMVNVNWGSKSTQFHGQGMRDHRYVRQEKIVLSEMDDGRSLIEWRHDDNNFVINFVSEQAHRLLKIFNRDGILQHTSEYTAGLQKPLAWKPSGSLIAAAQLKSEGCEIIFFEKNGLKHDSFNLPSYNHTFTVVKLSWSLDSTILLVCGVFLESNPNFSITCQDVLLFHQNNYCWFLKQKLRFCNENCIADMIWDENDYLRLHFISSNGLYLDYHYEWQQQTTKNSNVLFIDGDRLKISDLQNTLVPPPEFTYSIGFISEIQQVCHSDNFMVIVLFNNSLILFELMELNLANFNETNFPSISYNFSNVCANFEMAYFPIYEGKIEKISEMTLLALDKKNQIIGVVDNQIARFNYQCDKEISFGNKLDFNCNHILVLPNGKILMSDILNRFHLLDGNDLNENFKNYQDVYDGICSQIFLHTEDQKEETHLIVLTKNSSLYYDEQLLIKSSVNSVLVHNNEYILFTTMDNLFYCWPLKNFDLSKCKKNFPSRNLERGSKMIAVSNSDARVVLELPRGNFEAFYPRVLLLDYVNQYLEAKEFVKALEILRRHRINLNYLCDFNLNLFVDNCNLLVNQLVDEKMDWLCLFLFDLSDSNYYHILTHQTEIKVPNKLDIVCDNLRKTMEQIDEVKYIKPILLCHIKKENPEIVEALFRIKNLEDSHKKEQAIKFVLLIIDIDKLLEEALGTYDFDLVVMIASKSDRDPKEYLKLIENFKKIDNEDYRKCQIDFHLRRYKKSLYHLSKCSDRFYEALELIQDKHLFKEAIEIFDLNNKNNQNTDVSRQIWNIYGDYLFKKCYYEEAAIAYKRAKNYFQAYKMFVQISNWNSACICAKKFCRNNSKETDSDEDYRKLLKSLSHNLIINGNHIDAAYINERYLNDYVESFNILVKGHQWERALRIYEDNNLEESLFENEFKTEMIHSYEHILDNVNNTRITLSDHLKRLKELKEISNNRRDFFEDNNKKFGDADTDSYSDTSSICSETFSINSLDSNTSINTLKTNKSSSSRMRHAKKMQQKKYILKRGSINEDVQIIYSIRQELISRAWNLFKDGSYSIKVLYEFYYVTEANLLKKSLNFLENQINDCIEFIWNSDNFHDRLEEEELLRNAPKPDSNLPNWKIILD